MPRDVDDKKTRKALRKLRKAKERAEAEGVELTEWEKEFVEGVDERLEKYGSAFADPNLGDRDEALSAAQSQILKQLDKKSRGKEQGGFKTRKPLGSKKGKSGFTPRVRDIHEDLDESPNHPDKEKSQARNISGPRLITDEAEAQDKPLTKPFTSVEKGSSAPRRIFRVIDGGKSDD